MTGFGQGRAEGQGYLVEVSLRSLNGRFLEIRVRGLQDFPLLQHRVEEAVKGAFTRGSLEVVARLEPVCGRPAKSLDLNSARAYLEDLRLLSAELDLADQPSLTHLLTLGVFREESPEEETLWPVVEEALAAAISMASLAREEEGKALQGALSREVRLAEELLSQATRLAEAEIADFPDHLRERVMAMGTEVDPARLAMEIAFLAERSDVTEELDKLKAHLTHIERLLLGEGPIGKELEFLAQELGREAATLGAKARGAELAQVALALRLSAERVREQARNVE